MQHQLLLLFVPALLRASLEQLLALQIELT